MRKEKGWSQQELADPTDLNRTTVGAIERGLADGDVGVLKIVNSRFYKKCSLLEYTKNPSPTIYFQHHTSLKVNPFENPT